MAVVLPVNNNISGALGTGLGNLAQQKLAKIHENMVIHEGARQIKGFAPNLTNEQAQFFAYLKATSPKEFGKLFTALIAGGGLDQPEEQDFSQGQGPAQSAINQFQEQEQSQNQSPLQSLNIPQKPSSLGFAQQLNEGALRGMFGNDPRLGPLLASISGDQQAQQKVLNQQNPGQQSYRPGTGPVEPGNPSATLGQQGPLRGFEPQQSAGGAQSPQVQPNKPNAVVGSIKKGLESPDLAIKKENLATKKEALVEQKKQNRINNAKPFVKQLQDDRKTRDAELQIVRQLKDLDREGNVNDPRYLLLLKTLGLDYGVFKTDETIQYDKGLAQLFQASLKGVTGIKNLEIVRGIKRGIPDLLSRPEARLAILDNIEKNITGYRELIDQEYSKVLEENDGVPPDNVGTVVQRRVEPKLRALYEQTSKDVTRAIQGKNRSDVVETLSQLPKASDEPGERFEFPDGSIRVSKKVDGEYKWVKE